MWTTFTVENNCLVLIHYEKHNISIPDVNSFAQGADLNGCKWEKFFIFYIYILNLRQ